MQFPSLEIRKAALQIVLDAAARHGIAPVLITCHASGNGRPSSNSQSQLIANVRREVQGEMITRLGMAHHVVAWMFGRDIRRVRASVLGIPVSTYRGRQTLVGKRRYKFHMNLMVPIGSQFCWKECLPQPVEKPRPVSLMKPLSAKAIRQLDDAGRAELLAFLADQARRVREVA